MPKRPHSSWNLSSRSRAAGSADQSLKAVPPGADETVEIQVHATRAPRLDHQPLAPHRADESPRHTELAHELLEVPHRLRLHRDHHPRRPLAEERQVRRLAGPDRAGPEVDLR